ncbi:MAG: hypothetical protein ACKO6J_00415 [Crocinitomicaceae bacterium]
MRYLFLLLLMHSYNVSFAQPEKNIKNADAYDYMLGGSWMSSGYLFSKIYSSPLQNINLSGRLLFDLHISEPWSIESSFIYEKIALFPVQITDTNFRYDSISRYNLDFLSKFTIKNIFPQNTLEPYIVMGGGLCQHQSFFLTANFGIGVQFWITNKVGLQAQSLIKMPMSKSFVSLSYLQSNVGLIYRFLKATRPEYNFESKRYHFKTTRKRIKIRKDKES